MNFRLTNGNDADTILSVGSIIDNTENVQEIYNVHIDDMLGRVVYDVY